MTGGQTDGQTVIVITVKVVIVFVGAFALQMLLTFFREKWQFFLAYNTFKNITSHYKTTLLDLNNWVLI